MVWKWRPVAAPARRADRGPDHGEPTRRSPSWVPGMHPWGKWGRNFVEYGLAAAGDALTRGRRGLDRHPVRGRRRHHPQRLPRLRGRRHLRPGPGLDRRPGLLGLRRLRLRRPGHQQRPGPDPGRPVRRGPRGRGRHHPQGLLQAGGRRPQGRSGLAALPPHGRHQSHLLRPLRPSPDGAVRRHRGRLRRRQGEERPPRPGEPVRPVPQGGDGRGGARLPHGRRPAAPPRDLRHLRRRRRPGAVLDGVRQEARRHPGPRHHRRRLHRHPPVPAGHHRDAQLLDRLVGRRVHRGPDVQGVGGPGRLRGGRHRPRGRQPGRGLRPLLRPRARLVRGHRPVQAGRGREAPPRRRHHPRRPGPGERRAAGLSCFGEAIPAQAIAQVCELVWQLRGQATGRQVEGATVGITANQGLFGHGSSVIVTR